MKTRPHIIKRQVLDIRLERQEDSFQIQNRLSALCSTEIPGLLDEVCSKAVELNEYIRLDKLEIDLGLISLTNLEEEFNQKVSQRFLEALTERIDQTRLLGSDGSQTHAQPDAVKEGPVRPDSAQSDQVISPDEYELELIRYFLRSGSLPWQVDKQSSGSLEKIFARLISATPDRVRSMVKKELDRDEARQRLVYQFSDKLLANVALLLYPGRAGQIRDWLDDLAEIGKWVEPGLLPEFRIISRAAVLAVLSIHPEPGLTEKEMLSLILKYIAGQLKISYNTFIHSLQNALAKSRPAHFVCKSGLAELISTLATEIQAEEEFFERNRVDRTEAEVETETRPAREFTEQAAKDAEDIESLIDRQGVVPTESELAIIPGTEIRPGQAFSEPIGQDRVLLPGRKKTIKPAQFDHEAAVSEIYIENAGLILLWPYLDRFFKHFGLLGNNRFVDEAAAMRAICLLQYLATGKTEMPEFLLGLNKSLCGWDISKPIPKTFQITDEEKTESEKLLQAVITHWSALKNTSIKGLRTSFLQRNGVLIRQENNWLLRIERKTYDILLEKLPWTISMVKLSWMKTILYVEW